MPLRMTGTRAMNEVPDWYDIAVVGCLAEILRRYGPERAALAMRAYAKARP